MGDNESRSVQGDSEPQLAERPPLSRRQFLRMAGIAGAAVAVGSSLGGLWRHVAAGLPPLPRRGYHYHGGGHHYHGGGYHYRRALPLQAAGGTATTTGQTGGAPVVAKEWDFPHLSVLSGPVAFAGVPALWGSQYAAKKLNAAGGIRGVPVKVTGTDTAWDAAKAVTAFTNVSAKALAVLGPLGGPESAAMVPLVTSAKVMSFASYTTDQEIKDGYPWVAGYMQNSSNAAAAGTKKWLELNSDIKTLVYLYDPSDPREHVGVPVLQSGGRGNGRQGGWDGGGKIRTTRPWHSGCQDAVLQARWHCRPTQDGGVRKVRSRTADPRLQRRQTSDGRVLRRSALICLRFPRVHSKTAIIYNLFDPTSQDPDLARVCCCLQSGLRRQGTQRPADDRLL